MWFFVRSPYFSEYCCSLTRASSCTAPKKTDPCFWDGSILGTIDLLMRHGQHVSSVWSSGAWKQGFRGRGRRTEIQKGNWNPTSLPTIRTL